MEFPNVQVRYSRDSALIKPLNIPQVSPPFHPVLLPQTSAASAWCSGATSAPAAAGVPSVAEARPRRPRGAATAAARWGGSARPNAADPWRAAGNAPRSRCGEGGNLVNLEVEVGKFGKDMGRYESWKCQMMEVEDVLKFR